LKRRGGLPADEVVALGLKLASALAHLHAHGLVHRDVKPSNILFVGGEAKLADAGLVAALDDARSLVGTPGYIPPEGPGTPQADIYSLGKVLYETAFGKDRTDFPQLPSDLTTRTDHAQLLELNEVLLAACAKDPAQRYQSAEEMLGDLELLQRGNSVKAKRAFRRRAKLGVIIGLVAAVLMLVGAMTISAVRHRSQSRSLSSNPEAQKLYEQAKFQFNHITSEDNRAAFSSLWQAVHLDTNFVAAYYKLFECYFGPWGGDLPPHQDMMKNMRWVADHLRRVPKSPEYLTVNSLIQFYDYRFDEAIAEVERALARNPNFARARALHAWYLLLSRGDVATAKRDYKAAEFSDPADMIIQAHRALPYYFERNFQKAIELTKEAVGFYSSTEQAHELLGRYYEAAGYLTNAIDEYEAAAKLAARKENVAKVEAEYTRQRANLKEKGPEGWRRAKLEEAKKAPNPYYYALATLCAELNDREGSVDYLEKAFQAHDPDIVYLLCDDWWDPLRNEPRFQDLVARVGVKQKR
jgi:tetratricopeptide (TPR) repeat protein